MSQPVESQLPTRLKEVAARRLRVLRSIYRFVRLPLAAYLFAVLLMMLLEESLIFFPSVYPDGNWSPRIFEFEEANFVAEDGVRLHGWYVPHDEPRALVLIAHGNGGNLTHRTDLVAGLHRLGMALMIFDYRGYGRSEGKPTEAGILLDARAARRWLAERAGVGEADIVLFGESLGGGVVVDLAASDGARGLILLSTFSSLHDVAAHHYPWLPIRLVMRSRLNSAAKIPDYHGPLLQMHGNADTIVPLRFAERLFDKANEPKRFVTLHNGDHNDAPGVPTFAAIDQFVDTLEP